MASKTNFKWNLNARSPVIRDVIWSTSVQHGAEDGALVIERALAGQNLTKISDKEIITRIYRFVCYEGYPIRSKYYCSSERSADNGRKYFSNKSESIRQSVLKRFKQEEKDAIDRLN